MLNGLSILDPSGVPMSERHDNHLGEILEDGLLAGLIGFAFVLPIPIYISFKYSSISYEKLNALVTLAMLWFLIVWIGVGILAGYLCHRRGLARKEQHALTGGLAGLITGSIGGLALGFAISSFNF
jgi:hypothetical protein